MTRALLTFFCGAVALGVAIQNAVLTKRLRDCRKSQALAEVSCQARLSYSVAVSNDCSRALLRASTDKALGDAQAVLEARR